MKITNSTPEVYCNGKARDHAAKLGTRGAYRARGQGLEAPYVKSSATMKFNTGARGLKVLAGVGQGRLLLWEYIDGRNWSGHVAAEMYNGPLLRKLKAAYPGRKHWNVLEDNGPAGFKSKKGIAAKAESGIKVFQIPRRSPELNVCDFALWSEINRRMRRQERKWPKAKRETRAQYLRRLRLTALRLPSTFLTSSVQDMRHRCARLLAARGKHFEEGRE